MTEVTQRRWSKNIPSSPLLGNNERLKLEKNKAYLPKLKDKAEQNEALFRRLILTGENLVIISRPLLDNEGRPVSESPFMQKFLNDLPGWKNNYKPLSPENINFLLGNDNFTFPEIDAGKKIFRTPPVIHKNANTVGASDINELLLCSFLWWQKKQAEIYERNLEVVSHTDWGIMLHKFWECVWKRYRLIMNSTGKIFLKIAQEEWEKLLKAEDESYKTFSQLVKDFRLRRKLKGVEFRVKRLSLIQAEILDRLHDEGYEHKKILLEEEAHLRTEIEGVTFLGQCDRIEIFQTRTGEKVAFIVDYKEGKSETSEKITNINGYSWNLEGREKFQYGLQLSLYATLFEKNYNCKLSGLYILGLEDGTISGSFELNVKDYFTKYLPEKDNGNKKGIDTNIAGRIEEGNYAMECAKNILKIKEFTPEYQSDLCKFCGIKSLCRKGEFRGEILGDGENDTYE